MKMKLRMQLIFFEQEEMTTIAVGVASGMIMQMIMRRRPMSSLIAFGTGWILSL